MNISVSKDVFRGLKKQVEDLFAPENFEKGKSMDVAVHEQCSDQSLDAKSQEILGFIAGQGMAGKLALAKHAKIIDGRIRALSGSSPIEVPDEDLEIVTVTITRSKSRKLESTTELFAFRRGGADDDHTW